MSDFTLISDLRGWEFDLQSVYSAYIGHFQQYNIPWFDRSWGHLFTSFDAFLEFSWPTVVLTDADTSKPHIVTHENSITTFLKMIKTRFGETLPFLDGFLQVDPHPLTSPRPLRTVNDSTTYKRLHATLPAAVLCVFKAQIRAGEPKAVRELWAARDKTFVCLDWKWNDRANGCIGNIVEWGYAAVRCGVLDTMGHWPPVPEDNYRKGHYIISENINVPSKRAPTYPWEYAFGESQIISKNALPVIIESILSSLASPDCETVANTLVLVTNGNDTKVGLGEMKIKLPHNTLIIDLTTFSNALRSQVPHLDGTAAELKKSPTLLPLETLLTPPNMDIGALPCRLNNAGNDAFMTLFALQKLLDPQGTQVPTAKKPGSAAVPAQRHQQHQHQQHHQQQHQQQHQQHMSMAAPAIPPHLNASQIRPSTPQGLGVVNPQQHRMSNLPPLINPKTLYPCATARLPSNQNQNVVYATPPALAATPNRMAPFPGQQLTIPGRHPNPNPGQQLYTPPASPGPGPGNRDNSKVRDFLKAGLGDKRPDAKRSTSLWFTPGGKR